MAVFMLASMTGDGNVTGTMAADLLANHGPRMCLHGLPINLWWRASLAASRPVSESSVIAFLARGILFVHNNRGTITDFLIKSKNNHGNRGTVTELLIKSKNDRSLISRRSLSLCSWMVWVIG